MKAFNVIQTVFAVAFLVALYPISLSAYNTNKCVEFRMEEFDESHFLAVAACR